MTTEKSYEHPENELKRQVQRHWWNKLPRERQAEIIEPHFEEAHPTHEDNVKARREYQSRCEVFGGLEDYS